jgi:hypothetical protein
MEKFKEAEEYRVSIRIKPDYALGYLNLGVALSAQGLDDDARDAYRESIEHSGRLSAY